MNPKMSARLNLLFRTSQCRREKPVSMLNFQHFAVCSFLARLVFTPYAGVLFACYRNRVI